MNKSQCKSHSPALAENAQQPKPIIPLILDLEQELTQLLEKHFPNSVSRIVKNAAQENAFFVKFSTVAMAGLARINLDAKYFKEHRIWIRV